MIYGNHKAPTVRVRTTRKWIVINDRRYDRKLIEKIIAAASDPSIRHAIIDCFAGLGGVTAGFYDAMGYIVIACLNHWHKAIETHKANYPDCLHLEEDFKTADVHVLTYMVEQIRRNNPNVQIHVWWSFECTNFSNAKGGMSRDADSRSLAEDADRYVIAVTPDVMWVENVREFEWWGPMIPKVIETHTSKKGKVVKNKVIVPQGMDELTYYNLLIQNGKYPSCSLIKEKDKETGEMCLYKWMIPDPYLKGQDYQRWKKYICTFGYDVDRKLLNCADYGVPQHRIRLIMKFVRSGKPITWPKATHSKTGKNGLHKWLPVGPCLDLTNEGESLLAYKEDKHGTVKRDKKTGLPVPRIKSAKTIDRAIKGCIKHALKKDKSWLMKFNSAKNNTDVNHGQPIDQASPALTTINGIYLATSHTVDYYYGSSKSTKSIDKPAWQTGTKDGGSLQTFQFLSDYHSTSESTGLDEASKSLTTKDKYPLVTSHYIDHQFTEGQQNKGVDEPSGALQQVPKQKVMQVEHFIMPTAFDNEAFPLSEPSHVLTANRKHYYVISSHWFEGNSKSVDDVSNCIIASMDKAPPYLITTELGELAIEIYDYDPPHYKTCKKFMAENGIVSINMRMLDETELLKIMTLDNHKLIASTTDNKKMIGNAVPKKLVSALAADHDNGIRTINTLFNNAA